MSIELIIPPLGESISEAVVAKWLKPVGAKVSVDDPLAELETDKVTVTLPAPSAGVLVEQLVPVGASVRVGASIGRIDPSAQSTATPAPKTTPAPAAPSATQAVTAPAKAPAPVAPTATVAPATATVSQAASTRPALTPNTRKLLREQGVDPHTVAAAQPQAPARPSPASTPVVAAPQGAEEVVALSPLRKRIAERLVEAQHTAAILTTFNEVDMSYIQALRSKFQDEFVKKHGIKLGFMSFFVRACVEALREFPGLNAEMRGDSIAYKKHYDFGIAVGSGKGLVVPVLRGVERLSLAEIEKGIAELAQKAKDNKLQLSDLAGGTFSISNGGVYGSMMSTPLLNMPQTGILGMHNIIRRPIAVGDNIEIRPMMYLALSYDHRVVDGREAVSFLVRVKDRLESPEKLLLGL
jgi:2-oxoglutarate dehydrogenase E2 component (dihydrolipoamide succinyltransferase)